MIVAVLGLSLILDIALLVLITAKSKNLLQMVRFGAFAVIIDLLAYYIARGLALSFGENIAVDIVCVSAAKIFVMYVSGSLNQKKTTQRIYIYITVIMASLCIHGIAISGVLCEIILLAYLLYAEYTDKGSDEQNKTQPPLNTFENSLYLHTIEENYRKSRALWHDLNNHILCMRSLAENKQYEELETYINSLSEKIAGNAFPVKSGSIVLDALIADKYHKAQKSDIYIEFEGINYRGAIDAEDLCVVIGNLFDNAVEENLRSADENGRYIKIFISSSDDALIVRMKNPLNHELTIKGGLPSTTKPDVSHHGMGLKNVRRICDKYNGELLWTNENGIFEITARLIIT